MIRRSERRNVMVKHLPNISIEKYAAYLDGNLPDDEMHQIDAFIENDSDMKAFVEADSKIEENNDMDWIDDDLQPFDMLSAIELPNIDSDLGIEHNINTNNFLLDVSDRIEDEIESITNEINITNNHMSNKFNYNFNLFGKSDAASEVFGEPGNGTDVNPRLEIYQGYDSTCAIRSQQIILRDYGIDMSQEDLIAFAEQNGWFSEEGGTPMGYVGYILESAGVSVHQQLDSTIYDLINELAQGHRVIVGVDSGELWADREGNIGKQLQEFWEDLWEGQEGADHALIVAGVEVNPQDPSDVTVILTDPGTGDLRIEYSLDDFMDAWEDSHCFMVATDAPAPYQYDETRGMMIPSNFYCEEFINQNSYPLSPNALYIPEGYLAYYDEGHLNSVGHDDYENEISYDQFREVYNEAHSKYRQVLGSSAATFGQDHFDKKGFVDAIKGLFGHQQDAIDTDLDPDLDSDPDPDPDPDFDPDQNPNPEPDPDPDDDGDLDGMDDDE